MDNYIYYFSSEIDADSVNNLIEKLENIGPNVDLYFCSDGGSPTAMHILIKYLNRNSTTINIYLSEFICSSATFLLTDFKGKIYIDKSLSFILFHLCDLEGYYLRKIDGVSSTRRREITEEQNEEQLVKLKVLGLTDIELDTIRDGENVVFYKEDFPRLNLQIND